MDTPGSWQNNLCKNVEINRGTLWPGFVRFSDKAIPAKSWSLLTISGVVKHDPPHHDNIIYLPGEPIGCEYLCSEPWTEGGVFMSTYEEFMVLLTFGILIVTILEYVNHKK